MANDLFRQFENGTVVNTGREIDIRRFGWKKHKEFAGVFLKDLITADQTAELFTCHLVRIEPNCKIGMHTHPEKMELHEVIQGDGICRMGWGEVRYVPGTMAVIDCNAPHEVQAGAERLCLFAKFITVPAENRLSEILPESCRDGA